MIIVLTKHAKERMNERRISEFLIHATFLSPDTNEKYGDGYRLKKVLPTGDEMTVGYFKDGLKIIVATVFIKQNLTN